MRRRKEKEEEERREDSTAGDFLSGNLDGERRPGNPKSLHVCLPVCLTPPTLSHPVLPSLTLSRPRLSPQPWSSYLERCPPVRRALPVRAAGEPRAGNFCSAPCSPAEELPTTSVAPPAPPAVPPAPARCSPPALTLSRADTLKHRRSAPSLRSVCLQTLESEREGD